MKRSLDGLWMTTSSPGWAKKPPKDGVEWRKREEGECVRSAWESPSQGV